ncbi:asparaginase [Paenibacillus arenosi]|uniref:Asparaginase n=1 Tax=Paenibacillus arenosi TaxID=2774142 RepID=A0ABR9B0E0_9BACL|nr:asparaginase [Paenibacillus arenosi]MBD8499403.1 asparaginase [Paenibacillus arenosi]
MYKRLVEETRGGWVECEHWGAICAVDASGSLLHAIGDMNRPTFLRSAGKPLQAIPVVKSGVLEHYGYGDRELALMMSSHRGEDMHMQTIDGMMTASGLEQDTLVCHPSYPLHESSRHDWIRGGGQPERRFHNCSGKHFGVLAWCKQEGYELDTYTHPTHPAQIQITEAVLEMAGVSPDIVGVGTDGCGFPVYALPLPAIATAYLKLGNPSLIADEPIRQAVTRINQAMTSYPLLVGGTGRLDSVLMEDDNIVAKGGFKGVFGFALKEEQLGFAVKIADGSDEECAYVIAELLRQINYKQESTIQRLEEAFPTIIKNDQGLIVGERHTVFKL